jgi:NAD(P)-dependent dehydrogenase (short-subunit alcohol dehydrogenase family)
MAEMFDMQGRVAVVTGGYGTLGGAMARALDSAGARVVILGRDKSRAEAFAATLAEGLGLRCDVTDRQGVEGACSETITRLGRVDVLINAAGGNTPNGVVGPDQDPFTADPEGFTDLYRLNYLGTILPSLVFGAAMGDGGSIINIASVSAETPLSRVGAYGGAKAAVEHFTRWFAVELATKLEHSVRVNAIRPGFFIADQNRSLLLDESGEPTARGRQIVDHTPMGRFGNPDDLGGAAVWLACEASAFVTGTVVTVDGGFGAQRGV